MAAYMIASFDVTDQQAYEGYVPGMMPTLMKYGPEILVADYDATALEGEGRGVNVVIKFRAKLRSKLSTTTPTIGHSRNSAFAQQPTARSWSQRSSCSRLS